jgi:hypothetical protein
MAVYFTLMQEKLNMAWFIDFMLLDTYCRSMLFSPRVKTEIVFSFHINLNHFLGGACEKKLPDEFRSMFSHVHVKKE